MIPARLRPAGEIDLVDRTRWYLEQSGDAVARRFFDEATSTLHAIEKMPNAGSAEIGELCGVPGLRARRIKGFPAAWYYFVRSDHVDVVRLLADAQELSLILGDAD